MQVRINRQGSISLNRRRPLRGAVLEDRRGPHRPGGRSRCPSASRYLGYLLEQAALRAVCLCGGLLLCGSLGCATVPAGHEGILLTAGGAYHPIPEGDAWVPPGSNLAVYDLRVQEHTEDLVGLAADGAPIEARASLVAYHVIAEELLALHRELGPDFHRTMVEPVVQSSLRQVLAGFLSSELDTPGIRRLQAEVTRLAQARLRPHHIALTALELRGVFLVSKPAYAQVLATAQEEQLAARERLQISVARAQAASLRQRAHGIAASNELLGPTLTKAVLSHQRILAWGHLLTSPNSTVVTQESTSEPFSIGLDP